MDRLRLQAEGGPERRAFDAYAMVDWSSSSRPVTGNDSIWMASGAWLGRGFSADAPANVPTRVGAMARLREQLLRWRDQGRRVLVGFDFAFGYPAGFADALGLEAAAPAWRAVHAHFAAHVTDSPENAHNRDAFADACNRRIGAPGPFWGCCQRGVTPALTQRRKGAFEFPHRGLAEWRAADLAARRRATTQSVWKLSCGVSVGGQTILGIKHLHELATAVGGVRWPFQGWGAPAAPAVVFAEIFPSLVRHPRWEGAYRAQRDRTQVQGCVRFAAERDARGLLGRDLDCPSRLDAATVRRVEEEEGWILWVEREP